MPPMPFPIPLLFITAVKDICAINTFEKLLNILFSEVYCWYFGFITLLFSATITDMSLYEVLNLFPRWPLVFRSFVLPTFVVRDVVTSCHVSRLECDFLALLRWPNNLWKSHEDYWYLIRCQRSFTIAQIRLIGFFTTTSDHFVVLSAVSIKTTFIFI